MAEFGSAGIGLLALYLTSVYNEGRRGVCTILTMLCVIHITIADQLLKLDGLMYYGSSAIFQAVAVIFLINRDNIDRLAIDVCWILFAGILINFAGWLWWSTFNPPALYNIAMGVFYGTLIIRLWIRTKADGMGSYNGRTTGWWLPGIPGLNSVGLLRDKEGRS